MSPNRFFQNNYFNIFILIVGIACIVFLFSSVSRATENKYLDEERIIISDDSLANDGWHVYQEKCAVCHGFEGLGDGPLKDLLITKPADLTKISKRYGGDFPFWEIYEIIQGSKAPLSHGTREMPVWGEELANDATGVSNENLMQGRIKALLTYLKSIQK